MKRSDWDFLSTPFPVCPHCRHEITDTADLVRSDDMQEGVAVRECSKCEKMFRVTLAIEHVFSTFKLEESQS